ncbi:MAG: class I SAM-dependent methyltransferase [Ignavibacteriales bacterium CG12_big_fil_rev_8_21_14_0_65_30_8]|nr:MAG: class I SAM-dependent methyltransferase [Ignavibacteriales bacterium CG12_big_fil_rev_8_21_14_0_65_30_8]
MKGYYQNSLNSNKLRECYKIAPERVRQFLESEISFVASKCNKNDMLLDLGCGYGRVSFKLMDKVDRIVGIDNSKDNIQLAKELQKENEKCEFLVMNAVDLKFADNLFDKVICVQNGISAFNVDPLKLINESIRVTKKGGSILFSSYSEKFWDNRLEWFQLQSEKGLIGEIDYEQTKKGVIICKDGFKAITYSKEDFLKLASNFYVTSTLHEVDNSSLFIEMIKL